MKALSERISHARELNGQPRAQVSLQYQSIGRLLQARVEASPDAVQMIWYDAKNERGELDRRAFFQGVRTRSGALLAHNLKPGDRVATFSGNYPETVLSYFACWSLGLTVVPLNVKEDRNRLRWILSNSKAKAIITRPELKAQLKEILSEGGAGHAVEILTEPLDQDTIEAADFWRRAAEIGPSAEALIVYTSGTTGNPKGVVLDHYNLLADAQALAEWHRIDADSRMMCVLPIHHVNGTVVTLLTPLYGNASFVLNERFSVGHFFPRLAAEGIAVVSVVPTLLAFLLEADVSIKDLDLSRLRHIICGAGPLTVDLAMRFERRFNIPIAHGYGLSETTCYSCCLPVDLAADVRRRWLSEHGYPSIGAAFPVNEMAIHDLNGRPVPAGQRGEIVIRGHNVMEGYFANPQANEDAFTFGWFRSGDEGFWLPGEGGMPYFFITGRLKELIIRGGVNISPFEVDEVLMAIPGVRAGISVGFPHDLYGEEVGAYVQLDGSIPLDQEAVIAACRRQLPYFKCPKVVLFGDEIPVTSTGKYQRNRLKHLFDEWRTARFKD